MLDRLWAMLSSRQQDERVECFEDTRKWVQKRPANGVDALCKKSFSNRKMGGGIRVDIEVIVGKACVDDSRPDEEPDEASEDGQT